MIKVKENFKNLIPAYVLSFVISFMLYIYEPILIYSANMNDFWFDFKTMIFPIMLFFANLFLALSIIYTIIYWINKRFSQKVTFFKVILVLSFIAFLYIYIQGNYLASHLPSLDGTTIEWSTYTTDNVISIIVLIFIILVESITIKKFKIDKVLKVNKYISIVIFLMLTTSLVSTLFTPNIFKEKIVATSTTKNINNASSDKNFFIFLVDAVDSKQFSEVVKESKEYNNTFDDFTYYPDTVSTYLFTRDSIPFIFSGEWNENKTEFSEYSNKAFSDSLLLNNLKEKEYNMNFYEYQINWSNRKAGIFSNVDIDNKDINNIKFFKQLTKYILFKYLPYPLKPYSRIQNMDFDSCRGNKDNNYFNWSDDVAYNTIKNNKIEIINDKYFQFMHIEGGHVPFDYDENVNKISEEDGTYEKKLKATLKIINAFINRLKENNVYDNSAIIVMADHGYRNSRKTKSNFLYKRNK